LCNVLEQYIRVESAAERAHEGNDTSQTDGEDTAELEPSPLDVTLVIYTLDSCDISADQLECT
jgi:hypothetical protein